MFLVDSFEKISCYFCFRFVYGITIVFELCNDGKLEEAHKKLTSIFNRLKYFYKDCKEEFFVDLKRPLQHIILSYKAHLLKAYSVQLQSTQAQQSYYVTIDKVISN